MLLQTVYNIKTLKIKIVKGKTEHMVDCGMHVLLLFVLGERGETEGGVWEGEGCIYGDCQM